MARGSGRTSRWEATWATAPTISTAARAALAALPATRLVAASAVEETAPLAGMDQPPYLNQMVLLETGLEPRALLAACQAIERSRGRVRDRALGPAHPGSRHRPLRRIAGSTTPTLSFPIPSCPDRDFWMRELAELEAHER